MAQRKATGELLRYLVQGRDSHLAGELARWLESSPRFASFAAANRDKIRKKLRMAQDDEACDALRAELLTAYRLLFDRRFDVAFEAYGSGQRGPDLAVTFRSHRQFNVEVTHIRPGSGAPPPPATGGATEDPAVLPATGLTAAARDPVAGNAGKLPSVLLGKLHQLPPGVPNLLVVAVDAPTPAAHVVAAARLLKTRAEHKDDDFFARRGFASARDFYAHYLRLSAVFLLDGQRDLQCGGFWHNPEAKYPLIAEAAKGVLRCLAG